MGWGDIATTSREGYERIGRYIQWDMLTINTMNTVGHAEGVCDSGSRVTIQRHYLEGGVA